VGPRCCVAIERSCRTLVVGIGVAPSRNEIGTARVKRFCRKRLSDEITPTTTPDGERQNHVGELPRDLSRRFASRHEIEVRNAAFLPQREIDLLK